MDVGNSHSHNNDDNDRHLAKLCEIYFPSSHHHQKETYQSPAEHPAEQRRQLEDLYKMKAQQQQQQQQQQQLILQQMYWQQMQQVNQIVQNPHQIMNSQPSTNTKMRKPEKMSEKKQTSYLVAAANLQAVDEWAWRKYGQKPIKGCNYPRSYYKCSSSKGCRAKKRVEKILVDPDVYMVTYKGEHAHLNPVQPILSASSVFGSIFVDNNPLSDVAQPPLQPPPKIAPEAAMEVVDEEEKKEELLIPNLMMVDQDMLTSMEELKNYYKRFNDSGHDGSRSSGGSGFN